MKPDFAVETNGASVFLASSFSIKDIDKTALGVLRANRDIKGLAPCIAILRDDEMIVKYDITSRKTATEMLRSGANKKMVSSLLLAMAQAQRATEEYPIETCNFILSLDRIYMNPIDFSAVLICVPVDIGGVSAQDMNRLCKLVVSEASYVAGEAIDYVKQIVNLLNSPDFTYQRLQSEMESLLASADSPSPRPTQPRPKPRVQEVPPQPESLQSQDYAPQAYAPQGPARPYPTPSRQQKSAPAPQSSEQFQEQPSRPAAASQPYPTPAWQQKASPAPQSGEQFQEQPSRPAAASQPYPTPARQQKPAPESQSGEPKMTMLWLLQHYSKENKAKYDAQKQLEKDAKDGAPAPQQNYEQPASQYNFAVPGQAPPQKPVRQAPQGDQYRQAPQPDQYRQAPQPQPARQAPQPDQYRQAPQPQPVRQAPQPQPVRQAPPPQPARQAPQPQPVRQAPQPQPVRQAPQPQPVRQAPQPQPVRQAPQPEPARQAPAPQSQPLRYQAPAPPPAQEGQETELFEPDLQAFLVRANGEQVSIDKDVFNIGRASSFSDMQMESVHVGRQHCMIERVNSQFFITDLDSKNKTYVNGNLVWPYTRVQIYDKNVIRVADEEFEFRLG